MSFTHYAKLALLGALIGVLPSPIQALPYESSATGQEHKFLTNKTLPFAVDGANLPDIDWDIGENYAGLLPIGDQAGNELFFWFVPANNSVASKEITIWLNGGPGCSSMLGLLQENGPINWQAGQLAPMPNIYSWSNLTNVVWVDQPAGTGYSNTSGRTLLEVNGQIPF